MGYNDLPEGIPTPCVGDEILIRGIVKQYMPGVGVLVELFSKTDQYEAWVRLDLVDDLRLHVSPDEPSDGTWLEGVEPGGTNRLAFIRDDRGSSSEPERRHQRHWFDVAAQEFVDWPTAVKRGADPSRPLGVSL